MRFRRGATGRAEERGHNSRFGRKVPETGAELDRAAFPPLVRARGARIAENVGSSGLTA
jgi:hypothetical protein